MKKIVLKAEINCEKCRRDAFEAISGIEGIESVSIDVEEKKVTVIGDADPATLTMELRKLGWAEIVSVGPQAKEDKSLKVNYSAKDGQKQVSTNKMDSTKKGETQEINIYLRTSCHHCEGMYILSDENPNACSIS